MCFLFAPQVMAKGAILLSGQTEIRDKGVYNTLVFFKYERHLHFSLFLIKCHSARVKTLGEKSA